MSFRLQKTRTVGVIDSDLARRDDVVAGVMASPVASFVVRCFEGTVGLDEIRAARLDVLIVAAMQCIGATSAIAFVERCTREMKGLQVIYLDGEPTATPDVYRTDHVCLLPRSFTSDQLAMALEQAERRLRTLEDQPLIVSVRSSENVIMPRKIVYIESDRRVLHIHMTGGVLRVYGKLPELMQLLPSRFIQCHKSFLVNLAFVEELSREHIRLTNGESVPVSQKRRRYTRDALHSYVGRKS